MRGLHVSILVIAVGSIGNGCSCSHNAATSGDGGNGDDMSASSGGDIVITPADATIDITAGGAPGTQLYTAKLMSGQDVTTPRCTPATATSRSTTRTPPPTCAC